MHDTVTVADLLGRVIAAYAALASVAEEVDDEWAYVTDLSAAWRERLEDVVGTRGAEVAGEPVSAAIDRLIDEVGSISDPHRAIDWLSTFPQVALTALGQEP